MTFASWRVLIALVFGWTAILFGADFLLDPHSAIWTRGQSQDAGRSDGKAYLRIWLRYPCRAESTCLPVASDAVKDLVIGTGAGGGTGAPWMTEPKLVPYKTIVEELANAQSDDEYSVESILIVNRLEAEVPDPKIVDFMDVIRSLEAVGLVPDRIEYEGPGHYTIQARVDGLRDQPSRTDAVEAIGHLISEYRSRGYYRWLNSVGEGEDAKMAGVSGDSVSDSLRFFPSLGARVDIMEVVEAVQSIGLAPSSITIGTEAPQ
ncbi:MAG: hypothetical protein H6737_04735 [Alphaproteobacteria bacterium]|nr:hypothetical protein [Alphaproteobacteria bacterium]